MPRRVENRKTELETYYWVSSEVTALLEKGGYSNCNVSRKFREIVSQFDDLKDLYKRNDDRSADKMRRKETGGRYIFQKTLECYIIGKLSFIDKSTIDRLRSNLETVYNDERNQDTDAKITKVREQLEEMIAEKDAYFNEELTKEISSGSWIKLLNTKCNFICGEEGNCKGRCTPQILLELFEVEKRCKVRNEKMIVYSSAELQRICTYLTHLLPLGGCEADYKRIWKDLEDKESSANQDIFENGGGEKEYNASTIFTSVQRLQYGKADAVESEMRLYFENYYVKQCCDIERTKKLFERFTRKMKQKEELFKQISRWFTIWKYIIDRYVELRKAEKELKVRGTDFYKLIDLLKWEYVHKDFENCINKEREKTKKAEDLKKRQEIKANSIDSPEGEEEFESNYMQDQCLVKIGKMLTEVLYPGRASLIEMGESKVNIDKLVIMVMKDLEQIIAFMVIGWGRDTLNEDYSKAIINGMRSESERVRMVDIDPEND